MYSDNGIISGRQLFRQMIIVSMPFNLILFPYVVQPFSVIVGTTAAVILMFLGLLMIKKGYKSIGENKKALRVISWIIRVKHFFLGAAALIVIVKVVRELLLSEIHELIIIAVTVLAVWFFASGSREVFARFTEVLYYPVLAVILLIIVLSVFAVKPENINYDGIFNFFTVEVLPWEILLKIVLCLVLFLPWDGFFILAQTRDTDKSISKKAAMAAVISWLVTISAYIIIELQPGIKYMSDISYPFITMLKTVGIPGGFLERQEALFGIFVIMGLVIAMSFYMEVAWKGKAKEKQSKNRWWKAGTLIVTALVSIIYLGAFNHINNISAGIFTGTDIEDREYVFSIGIDKKDMDYRITYESEEMVTYSGRIMKINDKYKKESEKTPDFTHVKVVVLGEKIWSDEEALKDVTKLLKSNVLGLNAIMCRAKGSAADLMERNYYNSDSFGKYASAILINNDYEYCNILYFQDIINEEGMGGIYELPIIEDKDGRLTIPKTY